MLRDARPGVVLACRCAAGHAPQGRRGYQPGAGSARLAPPRTRRPLLVMVAGLARAAAVHGRLVT